VLRVIGIGGDTVRSAGDRIEVNGTVVDEDYVSSADQAPAEPVEFTAAVPADGLYLVGDVRNNAVDSRMYGDIGWVPTADVVGTVVAVNGEPVLPTTAFTDAGLPGAPYSDPGASPNLLVLIAGAVIAAAGVGWLGSTLLRGRGQENTRAEPAPTA
jgi:signal peptidase I